VHRVDKGALALQGGKGLSMFRGGIPVISGAESGRSTDSSVFSFSFFFLFPFLSRPLLSSSPSFFLSFIFLFFIFCFIFYFLALTFLFFSFCGALTGVST